MFLKIKLVVFIAFFSSINFLQAQNTVDYYQKHAPFEYTKLIDCTPIKNQFYSGTCWSFGTISFIESELHRKGLGTWNLSEMYIAYFSYLEKVKKHATTKGETFFTAGGQCHDVLYLVDKVGIVPEQIYNGKKGRTHHIHDKMDTLMQRAMNKILEKNITKLEEENLKEFKEIMQNHMGKIPQSFTWQTKTYTPLEFKNKVLNFSAKDYIELTSYTHHPYYKHFILESPYNWRSGKYYNLPFDMWIKVIDEAITNGYSLAWNGDVTEKTFIFEQGLAILPQNTPKVDAKYRQKTFEDKSSKVDHVMHIVGTAKSKNGEDFYIIKNSWGKDNPTGGYILMSKPYFLLKTVSVTVNKKALPKKLQRKL